MASNFYKISCIDGKKECNIIDPVSENLDFKGINPVSGQKFVKDDITSIMKRYDSMCLNKSGIKIECCDPMETRFTVPDSLKEQYANKKFKVNREFGKVNSIDMCDKNDKSEKCSGDNWSSPTPYLMCKIGNNNPELRNNVLKFATLKSDCFKENCNTQGNQISFGDLITGSGQSIESTYITDLRLADNLKEDNIGALKAFLDDYQNKNKKTGVDYTLTDNDSGDSLLLRSIRNKAIKCVSLLLGNGANINAKAMDTGMTTLHYACMYGNENMIANLINYGAATDMMDFKGRPPLFYAIMYGTYTMVSYLANQNPAMLLVRDKLGNTPLHIATRYSNDVGNVVRFLLDNGVSSETLNNKGLTASQVGAQRIKNIEETQQSTHTEMFLEPFETLGKAEENKAPESQIIGSINSGISLLQKAHVNENQNLYQGFITPQNNLQGPVNFLKYACYPDATIETQAECEAKGQSWQLYDDKTMMSFAKVDYTDKVDVDEMTDDPTQPPNDNYYDVSVQPVPERSLPPLDHETLMKGFTEPTETPTEVPTQEPTKQPTKEAFNGLSSYFENKNINYYLAFFIIIILIIIIFLVFKC